MLRATISTLVILIAVAAGVIFKLSEIPLDIDIRLTEETAGNFEPRALSIDEVNAYEKEGVVFIPNLLSHDHAAKLLNSSESVSNRIFAPSRLFGTELYSKLFFDVWRKDATVASLALQALPKIAVQLLPYSTNDNGDVQFRLLRDAFFQYSSGGSGCGWHVDDAAFWPTAEDKDGPTIWIALDEMKVSDGGGLAILNTTKFDKSTQYPELNLESCRQSIRASTCQMEVLSPECHEKMEASKLEWNMQPGDAIIWNRWTFHRGMALKEGNEDRVLRRYSVRYMPHGSKAQGAIHPSVPQGSVFDSPFYPQVWPSLVLSEMEALQNGLDFDSSLSRTLQFMLKYRFYKYIGKLQGLFRE